MEELVSKTDARELREKIDALSQSFQDVTRHVKDKAINGTKEWATEHPGATLGIVAGVAGGVGLIVGLLLARSRD
jgi:ElaB/YqjD/DUF883 family membrane-anchored ribosome-binding protein